MNLDQSTPDPVQTRPEATAHEVFVEPIVYAITIGRPLDQGISGRAPIRVLRVKDKAGVELGAKRWAINHQQEEIGYTAQFWLTADGQWVWRNEGMYPTYGSRAWTAAYKRWARQCLHTREQALELAQTWAAEHGSVPWLSKRTQR